MPVTTGGLYGGTRDRSTHGRYGRSPEVMPPTGATKAGVPDRNERRVSRTRLFAFGGLPETTSTRSQTSANAVVSAVSGSAATCGNVSGFEWVGSVWFRLVTLSASA